MKKIISLITAAALALGTTTAFAQDNGEPPGSETISVTAEPKYSRGDTCSDGVLEYKELADGTYEVSDVVDEETVTEITIPAEVNGKKVTSIGHQALALCDELTTITIPDSVINIDRGLGYSCDKLYSIKVDENNAKYCSVDGVLFNKSMTEIIRYPMGKQQESYIIPDGVTNIGEDAFAHCKLTDVTIPKGVKIIEDDAFFNCLKLTKISIPKSVVSIGEKAVAVCYGLVSIDVEADNENYCSENGVLFNKTKTMLIQYPASDKRESYTIPDSVEDIAEEAFNGCRFLTTATVPKGVTHIAANNFENCDNLVTINVAADNSMYLSVDGVLFNKSMTELIRYPKGNRRERYTIPNGVTSIGRSAFWNCYFLTSVNIPNGVTCIGNAAFWSCKSLKAITIPESVTLIEDTTFPRCEKLKDVYYSGTEEQWRAIKIGQSSNECLTNATIHYNSTGPAGTPVEVTVKAPEGADISDQSATTTVNGETKPLTITDGKLDLSGLANGTYTFTFSANNCAPRDYKVTVSDGTAVGLEEGVELHLYGDINGDGKINTTDILKAKLQTKGSQKLDGYDLAVADANKDGRVNGTDVLKLKLHAKGSTKLW